MRGLVGEDGNPLHRTQELTSLDDQFVRVLLWDHCLIVGIFPVDKPTDKSGVVKSEFCIGFIVFYQHLTITSRKNSFQKVQRLFRHDELGCLGSGNIFPGVLYQLVGIGGNKGKPFRGELKENSAHYGSQVIVARGKYGLADGGGQHVALYGGTAWVLQAHCPWKFLSSGISQGVFP